MLSYCHDILNLKWSEELQKCWYSNNNHFLFFCLLCYGWIRHLLSNKSNDRFQYQVIQFAMRMTKELWRGNLKCLKYFKSIVDGHLV